MNKGLKRLSLLAVITLCVAGGWWLGERMSATSSSQAQSPSGFGAPDRWADWQGEWTRLTTGPSRFSEVIRERTLMFFGFTQCPDICPTVLNDIRQATTGTPFENLPVVLVTVDPQRDHLEQLASYTAFFGDNVSGLRFEPETLPEVARSFGVFYRVHPSADPQAYTVDHSGALFSLLPDGTVNVLTSPAPDTIRDWLVQGTPVENQ